MFQGEISHDHMSRHLRTEDYSSSNLWRHVKGINLLSCLVRYADVALPIGYEVVKKHISHCVPHIIK